MSSHQYSQVCSSLHGELLATLANGRAALVSKVEHLSSDQVTLPLCATLLLSLSSSCTKSLFLGEKCIMAHIDRSASDHCPINRILDHLHIENVSFDKDPAVKVV